MKYGRRPQFFENGRLPQFLLNIEDDLNYLTMENLLYIIIIFNWFSLSSPTNWSHLPFEKIEVVFHLQECWGRLPFGNNWGRLPLKKIEVVFHISSSWIKIRLHTGNQLSRWCGGGGFFTDDNTTPTKVVISCFGLLVGLWKICQMIYNNIVMDNLTIDMW